MAIVSSTLGSPTNTGWKRRSSAASFSMCLRYSSSVVAPIGAQLAARQRRLEHVRGVDRALGPAGADDRVQLVDEEDDLALALGDLLEHGLEPVLELAAVLRAGDQRADVERDQALVLQRLGDVAVDDAPRQPLDDRGLADARLADEHRVVLRAPREHLHHAADLLVAADHRVELAAARHVREVAPVPLQRLVLLLGVLVGDALAAAHRLHRLEDRLAADAGRLEHLCGGAAGVGRREQDVLAGDVGVLERVGLALRRVEELRQPRRHVGLLGEPAADPRQAARSPPPAPGRSPRGRRRSSGRSARPPPRSAAAAPPERARRRPPAGPAARPTACAAAMASWVFTVNLSVRISTSSGFAATHRAARGGRLPKYTRCHSMRKVSPVPVSDGGCHGQARILIVDDSAVILAGLQEMFGRDYTIFTAPGARRRWRSWRAARST